MARHRHQTGWTRHRKRPLTCAPYEIRQRVLELNRFGRESFAM